MHEFPDITHDRDRARRIGLEEAIFCAQKTPAQINSIIAEGAQLKSLFFTRLSPEKHDKLAASSRSALRYDVVSQTAVLGEIPKVEGKTQVAIVSGGSSDASVVAEAKATLRYHGLGATVIPDVGVAGLWRLLDKVELIQAHPVVIAVAGMDAALPTVLGGLVPSSLIGVPTSTGYGASENGRTALNAMLASCAQGLTVMNIDNGFGAACAAIRIIRQLERYTQSAASD